MGTINYRQIFAKKEKIKKEWLRLNPNLRDEPGIYVLTREENGIKYGYIGQAVKVLSRMVSHSGGYDQWIDLSLKKHKLWGIDNPTGWKVQVFYVPSSQLNDAETLYIREFANKGYQLRNKTGGSQGVGKFGINDNKPSKTYRDGVKYGREKLKKELNAIIDKYLIIETKNESKLAKNGLEKFKNLLLDDEQE